MHTGTQPGYASSHGCVRLPYDFSQLLFSGTAKGGTVVIGDGNVPTPHFASSPGLLLAPKDFNSAMLHPLGHNDYDWQPERSPGGPVTIVVSSPDHALYVYRNGNPIGRAALDITGHGSLGGHVFTLLEGTHGKQSQFAPGRAAGRWMEVASGSTDRHVAPERLASRLHMNSEFATKLYATISPGTTVFVTDQPAVRKVVRDASILAN